MKLGSLAGPVCSPVPLAPRTALFGALIVVGPTSIAPVVGAQVAVMERSPRLEARGDPAAPDASVMPQDASAIEVWKAHLASLVGDVWLTSNAAYAEEDGGIEAYGMAFVGHPPGLAASGCLWGERAGQVTTIFWRFFQGWDPVRGAGLVYQVHPGGIVGIGYQEERGADEPGLVQEFRGPDGLAFRTGHFEHLSDPDTRVTRSVDWAEEGWVASRTYTWIRSPDRPSPC